MKTSSVLLLLFAQNLTMGVSAILSFIGEPLPAFANLAVSTLCAGYIVHAARRNSNAN